MEPTLVQEMGVTEQATFLKSILESSTEYSIIAKDLDGMILAWNEGARRIYGYEALDVVGKASAFVLHNAEDVRSGRAGLILEETRRTGKWEGELKRVRKNGSEFTAHVTITLRRDPAGKPVGFTMISRDLTESERIERELRESQEYNRGLIESNIDSLMTTDPLGIITDVNRQMCEMTGYSREELIGTPFKRFFADSQRAEDGIRKVLAEDRVTNYELTMRSRTGKETVVSYNATTFRSADGQLKGVFAAARDITEQKRLEEELRQTQNYTRGLIEASVDALVTVDPTFRITDVNEQTARITGYSREELIGSPFPDYFTDPERATAGVRLTLAESFVTNYVLVLRSKTGKETLVSFNASVFRDTEGNLRGIFAAARDITEQMRLEEELRQAQNYTRGLIESSVDPMITVDPDLTITDVNEQMVRLTEITKQKLIGSRFDTYFTEPARAAAGVRQTLHEGYVTNYELTLRTPSGREVLVSFNASIFRDTEGNIRGIFAVARDVTEQRGLEKQLREQQNYSRGLIDASVDALMTVNPSGVITDVNEQTVKLTGYSRKQLIGSRFAGYFTDPERAAAGVRKTYQEGVVTNYELVVRSKSEVETFVSFNASVFKDTAGNVAGILAAARDITQQKQIERELREQQAYNRGLIESNIDALMTTDPLGIITDVNRQMCAITGRSREELIGTPFKGYFTDTQRAEDGIRRVLGEGRVTNYELTIRAKDGRETVVSYNATTFTGEDGRLRGVFAAARDVTDQKRLEEQLRQAQNYNRGLIESSVDAMLTVAPDLTISDVNEQMVKLTGFSRDQLIGSAFQDYFTEPERAAAGVRKTLEEAYVTNYELTLRSRYRREILVSFNASVFKDTEGNIRGIFAVARDVTEQRRLEEQLRESQHYNRGLIESSVDALVTVDPDLTITDVNEQMIRLTGYTRDELTGSPFKDYFTEPDRAAAGVRQTLAEGSVTNYELVLKSKSGKRTVVSFNAGTFRDTQGRVAGILAAARDITAQKRLAEQLRDQQNYNRSLIESSVDALMTVDPAGVITDVNEQTVQLSGYNRKQLIGSPFIDYFTDPRQAESGVRQTFEKGVVTNYELVVRNKAGRKIPVSFNAAVFRDAGGNIGGILAAARDNTQQKRIEQELREQQSYTRGLIESNIDALMTTDTIGIITDVNRQMCLLTGRSREELIGTLFKEYFTDAKRAEDGIRRVLAEDRVTNYELTMRSKDGRGTVVSYNATTFKGADGRLRGVFAAARDITDQKRLEEQITQRNRELTETTTFLNNVLESSTEYSIIATDLDGHILTWNEGARRNYGYSAEEMVDRMSSSVLYTPEDIQSGKVQAILDTARKTGKAEGVFERVRKDTSRFAASVAITLRKDVNGASVGYLLISKDITEQKALEEELRRKNEELEERAGLLASQKTQVEQKNREVEQARLLLEEKAEQLALTSKYKSEFLANMSHELRTPLNSLLILSKILSDNSEGNLTLKQVEYAATIHGAGNDLLELINDILDLAKIESGTMAVDISDVPLSEIRDFCERTFRGVADSKRLAFRIESAADTLPSIRTDGKRLQQILKNLLSNGFKFTEHGGVTLRLDRATSGWSPDNDLLALADGVVAFAVADTGIGIPRDKHRIIFEAFQQADGTTSRKFGGTGLGLSISRELARLLGGEIRLDSDPGRGSTFTLYMPLSYRRPVEQNKTESRPATGIAANAPLRKPEPAPVPLRTHDRNAALAPASAMDDDRELIQTGDRTLLIIEDDFNFARFLLDMGREHGFKGVIAGGAADGLSLVRRFRPSAVTLDLRLPDRSGWSVLDNLKHEPSTRHIPVQIISIDDSALRALRLGAFGCLRKPATKPEVEEALTALQEFVNRSVRRLLLAKEDDPQRCLLIDVIGGQDVETTAVRTGAETLEALRRGRFDCLALDLHLPDMSGPQVIQQIRAERCFSKPTVVVYMGPKPDPHLETELRRIAGSFAIAEAASPEHLLAETALFLHREDACLSPAQRRILDELRRKDPALVGKKVLIVDDDVRNIFALTGVLERHDMRVLYAENGKTALKVLEKTPDVDLTLMDIMMPEMDGYEATRAIRKLEVFQSLPIIALTAKAMKGDREKCIEAGASDYITKPVDVDQLLSLLRVWLYV